MCSKYDCVIRFNSGSNPNILKQYSFYSNRTDISVLSGWKKGKFGPLSAYKNQKILFSRPLKNTIKNRKFAWFGVEDKFIQDIKKYTDNFKFIPELVFEQIYQKYDYTHPTTGMVTLFYIKNYLNKNLDCVNFILSDNSLDHFFLKEKNFTEYSHDLIFEKQILNDLNINNFKITQCLK